VGLKNLPKKNRKAHVDVRFSKEGYKFTITVTNIPVNSLRAQNSVAMSCAYRAMEKFFHARLGVKIPLHEMAKTAELIVDSEIKIRKQI